ncbi:MAG: hypothetical protein IPJ25_07880 [Rhodocyclaceae bacterium]|nr:hypothetical protein [Rhodocyclaceae bacterium]
MTNLRAAQVQRTGIGDGIDARIEFDQTSDGDRSPGQNVEGVSGKAVTGTGA